MGRVAPIASKEAPIPVPFLEEILESEKPLPQQVVQMASIWLPSKATSTLAYLPQRWQMEQLSSPDPDEIHIDIGTIESMRKFRPAFISVSIRRFLTLPSMSLEEILSSRRIRAFCTSDVEIDQICATLTAEFGVPAKQFRSIVYLRNFLRDGLEKDIVGKPKLIFIGNPPYNDGQTQRRGSRTNRTGGGSGRDIYPDFFFKAVQQGASEILFVLPDRFMTGGRSPKFREALLEPNSGVVALRHFPDSRDVFPDVNIRGGICFFHWKQGYKGKCTWADKDGNESERDLAESDVLVRDLKALPILRKVTDLALVSRPNVALVGGSTVLAGARFGVETNAKSVSEDVDTVPCLFVNGMGHVPDKQVTRNREFINFYKVIVSAASSDASGGRPDKSGRRAVFSKRGMQILPPGTVCTRSYIVVYTTKSEREAQNVMAYLQTKLVRFLVSCRTLTDLSRKSFTDVPGFSDRLPLDFSRLWDDKSLADHFELNMTERAYIDSKIK